VDAATTIAVAAAAVATHYREYLSDSALSETASRTVSPDEDLRLRTQQTDAKVDAATDFANPCISEFERSHTPHTGATQHLPKVTGYAAKVHQHQPPTPPHQAPSIDNEQVTAIDCRTPAIDKSAVKIKSQLCVFYENYS
jgi:hypothetical protein